MRKYLIGVLAAIAACTLVPVGTAFAAPANNVSFFMGGSGTAGWSGRQSSIELSVPTSDSYAGARLMHTASALPAAEPRFLTDFYSAGTPRWYISFADGTFIWGYPTQDFVTPTTGAFMWSESTDPNTYISWADVMAQSSSETVSGVVIVADGSAATPYSATITNVQYDGVIYGR